MIEKKKTHKLKAPVRPQEPVKPELYKTEKLKGGISAYDSYTLEEFNSEFKRCLEDFREIHRGCEFEDNAAVIEFKIDYGYYDSCDMQCIVSVNARTINRNYERQHQKYTADMMRYAEKLEEYTKAQAEWDSQENDRKRLELEMLEAKAAKLRKQLMKVGQ